MAWRDDEPVRGGYPDARFLALPGIERMRAGPREGLPRPPIHHLFGLTPMSASPVAVTFMMPCSPWLQSALGVFFAGTAALVADAPLGGAVIAPLGPGQIAVTSDLSLNFLRPAGVGSGRLVARARPIEIGRRLGLGEGLVEDAAGRVVAHATTRCFIMDMGVPDDGGPAPPDEPVEPVYEEPDPWQRRVPEGLVHPDLWAEKPFLEIVADLGSGTQRAPFMHLFGMDGTGAEPGRFWCEMRSSRWLTSPAGTIYGGVLAYFADTVLTGAVSTLLSVEENAATLDLKVQFLRPVWPDDRMLRCEARVLHRGRSFIAAQAEITNADGKVVVLAYSSSTVRPGGSWGSVVVADEASRSFDGDGT